MTRGQHERGISLWGNLMVHTNSVYFRPPQEHELEACSRMLPDIFRHRLPAHLQIALTTSANGPIGVGACSSLYNCAGEALGVHGMGVHVLEPYRRQGIGSHLYQRICAEAERTGALALATLHGPADGTEGERFLAAKGFRLVDHLTTFEADTRKAHHLLLPQRERLSSRRKIPSSARLVSLSEAPLGQVARMHADHVGPTLYSAGLQLDEQGVREAAVNSSVVLMVADRVIGLLLVLREGRAAVADSQIVAPGYRGGWANVVLLTAALQGMLEGGISHCRFTCSSRQRHALKMARRVDAEALKVIDVYRLTLRSAKDREARPCRRSDVREHDLWEESLLYAPDTEMAFALNPAAKAVWELCDGTRTVDEIGHRLGTSLGRSGDNLVTEVRKAVAQFARHGLLQPMGDVGAMSA